jgi:hypothetical protein
MRKLVLLFLFINLYLIVYNQVINGKILDNKTDSTICFAAIYFNGTYVGTSSDINGNFKLDISKNSSMPLTISAIGYYSTTLTDFTTEKPIIIYMTPKEYELKEVVIISESLIKERKANLKKFKNVFLGTTDNAHMCEIINENDITFNYNSDHDTLKAFASKPILINNKALGYKIVYYLDKFEYYKKSRSFFYRGNIIFNEDSTIEASYKQLYEKNRRDAYLGSKMHFFRSLWANDLESAGFIVKNSADEYLKYKNIVISENSFLLESPNSYKKFLTYNENIFVYYTSLSSIAFLKPKIYFDRTGYFDQSGISWEGAMVEQRIGDQLPYEYKIK